MRSMANTESCVLSPLLVEYLEEKEAIKSLKDRYQELTLEFASVKVELCDLDGMGWQKHEHHGRLTNGEQAVGSGHNKSRSRRKKGPSVLTSRSKVEKFETEDGAEDDNYDNDNDSDFTSIQYTGGTSLFRSGSSSFVNTFETSESDPLADTRPRIDSEEPELGNDDLRVKTPTPTSRPALPADRVTETSTS
ncbi:hypothetical protein E1B28_008035 [Marasmius oreades]|uniref:Uncharacterized protein n=1 Tax=Marasmius oreades TaxID=181124 RepID=A0A9P7S337_9AGAR|nr:uncharacterized protein E1B28_008035 [Marasmius oreades]KAG7094437.1 hypothetical protein E1B28_008035 [Marasmius oreades]